jgi:hypothetical protein
VSPITHVLAEATHTPISITVCVLSKLSFSGLFVGAFTSLSDWATGVFGAFTSLSDWATGVFWDQGNQN